MNIAKGRRGRVKGYTGRRPLARFAKIYVLGILRMNASSVRNSSYLRTSCDAAENPLPRRLHFAFHLCDFAQPCIARHSFTRARNYPPLCLRFRKFIRRTGRQAGKRGILDSGETRGLPCFSLRRHRFTTRFPSSRIFSISMGKDENVR